jgi:hypothetical protein
MWTNGDDIWRGMVLFFIVCIILAAVGGYFLITGIVWIFHHLLLGWK